MEIGEKKTIDYPDEDNGGDSGTIHWVCPECGHRNRVTDVCESINRNNNVDTEADCENCGVVWDIFCEGESSWDVANMALTKRALSYETQRLRRQK